MAAVTSIYYAVGFGSSFSGTLNLPQEMSVAVAQVALTRSQWNTPGGVVTVYLTGYSANGTPISVTDESVVLTVQNVDSFSFGGQTTETGYAVMSIMAYCFE